MWTPFAHDTAQKRRMSLFLNYAKQVFSLFYRKNGAPSFSCVPLVLIALSLRSASILVPGSFKEGRSGVQTFFISQGIRVDAPGVSAKTLVLVAREVAR